MPTDRWAVKATVWNAADCPRAKGRRPHAPKKRWNKEILQFLQDAGHDVDGTNWFYIAADKNMWKDLEKDFCSHTRSTR
eukprot:5780807-Pyramimonas_sp.AAC.1